MDLDTKLTIPAKVMFRQVDEEMVVLDLESGLYFGLDEVGKLIWDGVVAGKSLGEIASVISSEYEVNEAQAENDVVEFSAQLLDRGLLAR